MALKYTGFPNTSATWRAPSKMLVIFRTLG